MIYSFGDLNIDIIIDLPGVLSGTPADLSDRINTRIRPGGVAYNLFSKAVDNGHSAKIIGTLGDDAFGKYLLDQFDIETRNHIYVNGIDPTGLNVTLQIISGASIVNRIFLSNSNSANYFMAESNMSCVLPGFSENDILFFTGYNLFRPSTRNFCYDLVRRATNSNVKVVFDILPHDLSSVGSSAMIEQAIKEVAGTRFDLCIGEYRTWSYLFGMCDQDPYPGENKLLEIGRRTADVARFASIRYGNEHCSNESLFFEGVRLWDKYTGYDDIAAKERVGYGDLLTVELIEQLFIGQHVWRYEAGTQFTIPLSVIDCLPGNIDRGSKLLDIGAGYGRAYSKLNEMGFTDITGIESSISMVEEAKKNFPDIRTEHLNLMTCELPDQEYQIALMIGVLTTFQFDSDIKLVFEKVHKTLDKNGFLLIAEFAINDDGDYQQRYIQYKKLFPEQSYGTFVTNSGSIHRHFSVDNLKKMAGAYFDVCMQKDVLLESMSGNRSRGFVLLLNRRVHDDEP